jgi:hypothetical protein
VLFQPVAELGQREEVVFLLYILGHREVTWTLSIHQVLLIFELFAAFAVQTAVLAFMDISVVMNLPEQRRNGALVLGRRGANELVVRKLERLPRALEYGRHLIRIGLRILALVARFLLDIRRMLVGAHQEVRVKAGQALVARQAIGTDLLVRGAQVRARVDVVDGSRQVERRLQNWIPWEKSP